MPGKKASTEYSCVVCTARKVRCSKEKPCNNCIKAGISCEVAPPPPPRRRKRKLDERELVRKLARYEELMSKNGLDYHSADDEVDGETDNHVDLNAATDQVEWNPDLTLHNDETNHGPQQYHREFESASNAVFGNDADILKTRAVFHQAFDSAFDSTNSFPFTVGPSINIDLANMHPSVMQILHHFQTYLDNVDPLLKLTHTPTLQKMVFETSTRISTGLGVDKDLEALLFNMYFISAISLTEAESFATFGVEKTALLARYHVASQQALINAGLMRTLSLTVLQAFMLHLIALRGFVDPRTHYVLIGIAVRIAIRLGVHRDGSHFQLPPFEVEQRRRLWWNLVVLDKRIAETTGSAVTAMSTPQADSKRPLNLNDSDLYLHAKQAPTASTLSTEMVFCLPRYELAATAAPDGIHTLPDSTAVNNPGSINHRRPWETQSGEHEVRHVRVGLNEYADYVKSTFLRGLDQSIPLHLFTILMTRQNIRKLQLIAKVGGVMKGAVISSELRLWAFEESIRYLEDDNMMQTAPHLQGWLWYTYMYFPYAAYMFLVHELKKTPTGELCSRAWEAMDRNHKLRGLVGSGKKGTPIHLAYGPHFLEAWEARVQAVGGPRDLQTPEMIFRIQQVLQLHRPEELRPSATQPLMQLPSRKPASAPISQQSQIWQNEYTTNGMNDFDLFASMSDVGATEYLIPSFF